MDSINLLRRLLASYKTELYKRGVTVVDELGHQPLSLAINKFDLEYVLGIFIDNAVHFNRPNGKVIVTLINEKNNKGLILADTGIGIEPKLLRKIVKQSDSMGDGETNLSKAIKLVEQSQGSIEIESQPNVGTQVSMWWKQ